MFFSCVRINLLLLLKLTTNATLILGQCASIVYKAFLSIIIIVDVIDSSIEFSRACFDLEVVPMRSWNHNWWSLSFRKDVLE